MTWNLPALSLFLIFQVATSWAGSSSETTTAAGAGEAPPRRASRPLASPRVPAESEAVKRRAAAPQRQP